MILKKAEEEIRVGEGRLNRISPEEANLKRTQINF
jgi:hypothetical protein